jgi:hypothetical protein
MEQTTDRQTETLSMASGGSTRVASGSCVALLDTQNVLDWKGNGGDHRALQIVELLHRIGLRVRRQAEAPTSLLERHARGLALRGVDGFPIHRAEGEFLPTGRQALSHIGHLSKSYVAALSEHPRPSIYIWENATNTVGAHLAAKAGCAVVAVPQNVYTAERGFRDQWGRARGLASLERECDFLRKCDAVFCISREEQWLLRVQGIQAGHLPYYPSSELLAFLLDVRASRSGSPSRRFLSIGSATHPPTAGSLRELIEEFNRMRGTSDAHLDVAGHHTESLRPLVRCTNVHVHGTVTQDQLRELLVKTSAAVIHQRPGVGALTRIPEFLIAGVPVIANVDASRSTWTLDGVLHYERMEELEQLLNIPLPAVPLLERPTEDEERFCRAVRNLVSSRS